MGTNPEATLDPRKDLEALAKLTGAINQSTATFDIEFVSNGMPRRFDLQFVREGTNVVLGSIPVTIGTPIPGDGYEFEELDDGEIATSIDFGNVSQAQHTRAIEHDRDGVRFVRFRGH